MSTELPPRVEKPKKRRRYIVEHIRPSEERGFPVAIALERVLSARTTQADMENVRLVSLVPAGVDQPPDWYLATWEVFE